MKAWADYLVSNALNPANQFVAIHIVGQIQDLIFLVVHYRQTSVSDNIKTTNQTNLALKGILGIGAMGKIAQYAGNKADQSKYQVCSSSRVLFCFRFKSFTLMQGTANSYIQQWVNLSTSSNAPGIFASFGQSSSSGLIYNLFADKLLQLNLVPASVSVRHCV